MFDTTVTTNRFTGNRTISVSSVYRYINSGCIDSTIENDFCLSLMHHINRWLLWERKTKKWGFFSLFVQVADLSRMCLHRRKDFSTELFFPRGLGLSLNKRRVFGSSPSTTYCGLKPNHLVMSARFGGYVPLDLCCESWRPKCFEYLTQFCTIFRNCSWLDAFR